MTRSIVVSHRCTDPIGLVSRPELILLDYYTEVRPFAEAECFSRDALPRRAWRGEAIDLWSVGCIAFELAEMMEPKPAEAARQRCLPGNEDRCDS